MPALKVTTIGSSAGLILPREVMTTLKVEKGDLLYLTQAPGGGYRLTPFNPDFERQITLTQQILHDDREILRALAK